MNKETTPEWEQAFLELDAINYNLYFGSTSGHKNVIPNPESQIIDFIRSLLATATAGAREEERKSMTPRNYMLESDVKEMLNKNMQEYGTEKYAEGFKQGRFDSEREKAEAEQRGRDMAVDYIAIGIEGVVKELDSGMWMLSVDHSHFNDLLESARRGKGE